MHGKKTSVSEDSLLLFDKVGENTPSSFRFKGSFPPPLTGFPDFQKGNNNSNSNNNDNNKCI